MKSITVTDLLDLPADDRLRLAQDLWDSVAELPEQVEVTPDQRAELQRRLAAHRENPDDVLPWEEVRDELLRGR